MNSVFSSWKKKAATIVGHTFFSIVFGGIAFALVPYTGNALDWPLRILGFFLLYKSIRNFSRDLPPLITWLQDVPIVWWHSLCAWLEKHWRWFHLFECLLAVVLILLSAAHYGKVMASMSQSSLRVDEIGSINAYAGKGPIVSTTTYNLAKNHIFFSLVNSLTPGAKSMHPTRARFWSFVAVSGTLIALAVFFWRRGNPIAAAVAFALPALNQILLEKCFEARGFGFLTLAAAAGLIAVHGYLREKKDRYLYLLGISTILGTWTLPYYILFGGILTLLLFLVETNRKTFATGLATCLGVFAVYAPVVGDVLSVASEYTEDYGLGFESLRNVFYAISYAIPSPLIKTRDLSFIIGLCILLGYALIQGVKQRPDYLTLRITAFLTLGFYVFCLWMGSPPIRVTSFLAVPMAMMIGLMIHLPMAFTDLKPLRPLLAIIATLPLMSLSLKLNKDYTFLPDQRWRDAALAIKSLYPDGVHVLCADFNNMLDSHLDPIYKVEKKKANKSDWAAGNCLVFDYHHKATHEVLDPNDFSGDTPPVAIRFLLDKEMYQSVYVPVDDIMRLTLVNLENGNSSAAPPILIEAGTAVSIPLGSAESRSVHLLFSSAIDGLDFDLSLSGPDGKRSPIDSDHLTLGGNHLGIDLRKVPHTQASTLNVKVPIANTLETAWLMPK